MTNEELIAKIKAEIERRLDKHWEGLPNADAPEDDWTHNELCELGAYKELEHLETFLSTLESETTYDGQQYTPRPSVSIEDVARVQFASHAKVFDKKRKAVFDWEQFKEVAGIFYCFGKKDHLDTLESGKPINPDDAMKELDEKIALVKQRGTWDGVDVDKYMDEVRGREPEKPMNQEDIDTEIGHWIDRLDDKYCLLVPHYSIQDIKDTARHFAQWGAEHLADARKIIEVKPDDDVVINGHKLIYDKDENAITVAKVEPSGTKDLEEAKEAYCEEHNDDCFDATGDKCPHIRNAFIAGAKWDRSQIMQEAVEGTIDDCGTPARLRLEMPGGSFKIGDKVRIIICKKED